MLFSGFAYELLSWDTDTSMNDSEAIKHARTCLRRAEAHDLQTALDAGATHETVNMVEVIHHPTNALPNLNYLTPRQNVAWVMGSAVLEGMARLEVLGRGGRMTYYEGLLPTIFRQTLAGIGLQSISESQVYACTTPVHTIPSDIEIATTYDDVAKWWASRYTLLTGNQDRTLEMPAQLWERVNADQLCCLSLYAGSVPLGAMCLRWHTALGSAKVVEFYVGDHAADVDYVLMAGAQAAAARRGCDLLYVAGALHHPTMLGDLSFISVGRLLTYSRMIRLKETEHDQLAQSVPATTAG
jgi:hypothetical protein